MIERFTYIGFQFVATTLPDGTLQVAAVSGQHPAAYKDKHLRAAREYYESGQHLEEDSVSR